MLDAEVAAVNPCGVYCVLKKARKLQKWARKASKKGQGFVQPERPRRHWHIDISYINLCGTFYYLCTILDGSAGLIGWRSAVASRLAGSGAASCLEWAQATPSLDANLDEQRCKNQEPIKSADFPTPSRQPFYLTLVCEHFPAEFGLFIPVWCVK